MNKNSRSDKNIEAWDELYARTSAWIWGKKPAPIIERFVERIRASLDEESLLFDAATGEGRNLATLLELPGRCYACDTSLHALKKIDGKHRSKVETLCCPLQKLPYPDDHFSFILLWDTIETLPEIDAVIHELARVMVPGGQLLCNIPDEKDDIASRDMVFLRKGEFLYKGVYFYRFMSEENATLLLSNHGFNIQVAERHRWKEKAHTKFRHEEHWHESIVYLAEKTRHTNNELF